MYSMECLRTTGPLFRTYEPSDYRTFITESGKSRHRTYEPSDCRTFGMKNPLFRTHEPSDYRTFGLESSHHFKQFNYGSVLSWADHTYLRKMYRSFVLYCFIHQCHLMDDVCTDMLNLFKHYYAGLLWSFGSDGS